MPGASTPGPTSVMQNIYYPLYKVRLQWQGGMQAATLPFPHPKPKCPHPTPDAPTGTQRIPRRPGLFSGGNGSGARIMLDHINIEQQLCPASTHYIPAAVRTRSPQRTPRSPQRLRPGTGPVLPQAYLAQDPQHGGAHGEEGHGAAGDEPIPPGTGSSWGSGARGGSAGSSDGLASRPGSASDPSQQHSPQQQMGRRGSGALVPTPPQGHHHAHGAHGHPHAQAHAHLIAGAGLLHGRPGAQYHHHDPQPQLHAGAAAGGGGNLQGGPSSTSVNSSTALPRLTGAGPSSVRGQRAGPMRASMPGALPSYLVHSRMGTAATGGDEHGLARHAASAYPGSELGGSLGLPPGLTMASWSVGGPAGLASSNDWRLQPALRKQAIASVYLAPGRDAFVRTPAGEVRAVRRSMAAGQGQGQGGQGSSHHGSSTAPSAQPSHTHIDHFPRPPAAPPTAGGGARRPQLQAVAAAPAAAAAAAVPAEGADPQQQRQGSGSGELAGEGSSAAPADPAGEGAVPAEGDDVADDPSST